MSDTEEVIDLHSMKVAELKEELKSRQLPVSGAKAQLIERLENYMQEHEGVEVVEEEDTEESQSAEADSAEKVSDEQKTEESSANDISVNVADDSQNNRESVEEGEASVSSPQPENGISLAEEDDKVNVAKASESDRKQARANRFAGGDVSGNTTDELNKKKSRADRFGIVETKSTTKSDKIAAKNAAKTEKSENLKRRAERFGIPTSNGSSSTAKAEEQAKKLKSRGDRFGNSDGKKISGESSLGESGGDDKKAARAARFAAMAQ